MSYEMASRENSIGGSGKFISGMKNSLKSMLDNSSEPAKVVNGKETDIYQRAGVIGMLSSEFCQWRDEHRDRGKRPGTSSKSRKPSGLDIISDLGSTHGGKIAIAQLTHLLRMYGDKKTRPQFTRPSIGVPDVHKSPKWPCQEDSKTCKRCFHQFGALMDPKIHCRVCGFIHCRNHAQKQFVLFTDRDGRPQWCINGVNAPLVKPDNFVDLHACDKCVEMLSPYAADHSISAAALVNESADCPEVDAKSANIVAKYETFTKHQTTVSINLPRYTELVAEVESLQSKGRQPSSGLLEDISRQHCNLEVAFKGLADLTLQLKHIDHEGGMRRKMLASNFFNSCQSFHTNQVQLFRSEQPRVMQHLPKINHKGVLLTKSRQALENVYIVVRQLTYELLHLGDSYPFLVDMQVHLKEIADVVYEELEEALMIEGESCDEFLENAGKQVVLNIKDGQSLIPSHDPATVYTASALKHHVVTYCQTQLNRCNRHITNSTTVNGCDSSRRAIQSKLVTLHSMMEFMRL